MFRALVLSLASLLVACGPRELPANPGICVVLDVDDNGRPVEPVQIWRPCERGADARDGDTDGNCTIRISNRLEEHPAAAIMACEDCYASEALAADPRICDHT